MYKKQSNKYSKNYNKYHINTNMIRYKYITYK
jgi:hypothetical protein